jgi:hypothetical protein
MQVSLSPADEQVIFLKGIMFILIKGERDWVMFQGNGTIPPLNAVERGLGDEVY